ncbi:MAG: hypothetical protein K6E85_11595 [Lachnospiraceae bacterium]|nr:hypothetical protein [Lachnospiraceae bacterium]
MNHSIFSLNFFKALKISGKILGTLFKLTVTAIWTLCILSGGELGLAAIVAGIIFFGFSAILG